MRGTVAKRCRRTVRHFKEDLNLYTIDGTQYVEKEQRPKLVATGKLNADGTQQMITVVPVTRSLHPDCERRAYQDVKNLAR